MKEDLVAAIGMVFAFEEVVLRDFVERGRRREGRDMPAHAIGGFVGAHHHRHRVPAHQVANRALQLQIARILRFFAGQDGVDIRRIGRKRDRDAQFMRVRFEPFEQSSHAVGASVLENVIERFEPFLVLDILNFCRRGRAIGVAAVGVAAIGGATIGGAAVGGLNRWSCCGNR